MYKRVIVLILAGANGVMGQEAIKVTPAKISENRSTTLIEHKNVFSSDQDGLTLKLHLEGAALAGATKYGGIVIDSATDDLGTALKLENHGFHADDKFTDISHFDRSEAGETPGFDVPIELSLPPRKAGELVEVKGSLQALAGGEEKVVSVTKLPSLVGKAVDDPVLKSAGIKMTIAKIGRKSREINVDYTGSSDALEKVDVVDAKGQSISGGQMTTNFGGKRSTTYDLNHPIDDTVVLKLHVMIGQKTVAVPFDVKNVKLP